jgi:hypothetical protein
LTHTFDVDLLKSYHERALRFARITGALREIGIALTAWAFYQAGSVDSDMDWPCSFDDEDTWGDV